MSFTSTSPWPWVDHSVSGLQQTTLRPLQTRFPCGSASYMLNLAAYHNSPVRSSKSTPSDFNVLRLLVSTRFQVLFHSPPGVLFTFPSRYYSLSVAREYLALEGGPPSFTQDSTCPVLLTDLIQAALTFRLRGCHSLWRDFPVPSARLNHYLRAAATAPIKPYNPHTATLAGYYAV